jgi:hypothetical protein
MAKTKHAEQQVVRNNNGVIDKPGTEAVYRLYIPATCTAIYEVAAHSAVEAIRLVAEGEGDLLRNDAVEESTDQDEWDWDRFNADGEIDE